MIVLRVLTDLIGKEIQGRLDRLPFLVLRLARWRLPADLREQLHDEWWVPDLHDLMAGEPDRPITRLIKATHFAVGLVLAAGRNARATGRPTVWTRTTLIVRTVQAMPELAFGPVVRLLACVGPPSGLTIQAVASAPQHPFHGASNIVWFAATVMTGVLWPVSLREIWRKRAGYRLLMEIIRAGWRNTGGR